MLGPSLRVKKKLKYPHPGDAVSILIGGHILLKIIKGPRF